MKRALVTGGASPIGEAICRRLAQDGHHIVIHANAAIGKAQDLAREIIGNGGSAEAIQCDLRDVSATEQVLTPVLENGAIEIFVHNAGIHADAPLAGMAESQWRDVIDVSLNGFFSALRPVILPMIGKRWGRVIAVSSVSALMGNRGQVNYAAAKAGLIGAVRSLAREVGSRGVTANAVVPGIIQSPAIDDVMDKATIAEIVPMKRAGKPEEVADLIGFLASGSAGYITGQAISINGGMI